MEGLFYNLHLGRLSSHDVECFFGLLRRLSNGNESKSMTMNIIARSVLYKIIYNNTRNVYTAKIRINAGGIVMRNFSILQANLPISASNNYETPYLLMCGYKLTEKHYMMHSFQINCYTQKILHDQFYPKILKSKPYSGNNSTHQQRLPYGSTVIPININSFGEVAPGNTNKFNQVTQIHNIEIIVKYKLFNF